MIKQLLRGKVAGQGSWALWGEGSGYLEFRAANVRTTENHLASRSARNSGWFRKTISKDEKGKKTQPEKHRNIKTSNHRAGHNRLNPGGPRPPKGPMIRHKGAMSEKTPSHGPPNKGEKESTLWGRKKR